MKKISYLILFWVLFTVISLSAATNRLTLYQNGFYTFQQTILFPGPAQKSDLFLPALPVAADNSSFLIRPLSPSLVIHQVRVTVPEDTSVSAFLQKARDRNIEVIDTADHAFRGRLTGVSPEGFVLTQENTGKKFIMFTKDVKALQLPVPDDASTPAGIAVKYSAGSGPVPGLMYFQAQGIDCRPVYQCYLDDEKSQLDINGCFQIINTGVAGLSNCLVDYIDGDLLRTAPPARALRSPGYAMAKLDALEQTENIEPEQVFEYDRYSIPGISSLPSGQMVQIPFLSVRDIRMTRSFYFSTLRDPLRVLTRIVLTNRMGRNILPPGKISIFSRSGENITLAGENMMARTLEGDPIRIFPGFANDIQVERKDLDRKRISDRVIEITVEFRIKNNKTEKSLLEIEENFGGFWEIKTSTIPWRKNNSGTASFEMILEPESEIILSYTARIKY